MTPTKRRPMTLGEALRAERDKRGMLQREAAAELGVSQPMFSDWEKDRNEPGGRWLPDLMKFLHLRDTRDFGDLLYWGKLVRHARDELQ